MFEVAEGTMHDRPDARRFLETLRTLDQHPSPAARDFFDAQRDVFVARAPGRLDLMGGIADYSGSLVLEMPIAEATFAAVQRQPERRLEIVSLRPSEPANPRVFSLPLADLENERAGTYDAAARYFDDETYGWAGYVAGTALALKRECGVRFEEGARILIDSAVPDGKGVSSSAALEVATMQALAAAFEVAIEADELALLCQKVENQVVGAPCGAMDQMTSACGQADRLLMLLCQPAEIQGHEPVAEGLGVWAIDSDIEHAVSGSDYGSVRTGAFMGLRMIAAQMGCDVQVSDTSGKVTMPHPPGGGYLANISPSWFEQHARAHLPETMRGQAFLDKYQGITDTATHIQPERDYPVRAPTQHPIGEHFRVRTFAQLMEQGSTSEPARHLMGELMFQSHASYSACGLGSEGTDQLVQMVRDAGPDRGLYGAKITGGGSGGAVAVLGRANAEPAVRDIAQRYGEMTGRNPTVFAGSSPGAAACGTLRLKGAGASSAK